MILYIVRHGIAVNRNDPHAPPEPERPLTRKGIEKAREVMLGLRELGPKPDVMITSPYLRAAQTAEIACEVFGFPRERIRNSEHLKPGANPAEFLKELAHVRAKEVMCFGHAPHMDQLIACLAGARDVFTALKKAGVASFELESASASKGTLLWLLAPKVMRGLA
ncbi:MAG: histidine phosphatase family protein [Candidatus Acidiferrales bacterium]